MSAHDSTQRKPLSRFRVIDLTTARSGPSAVRQFADWGADVITIEPPKGPEDGATGMRTSSDWQNLHRNTRSLTLDLKRPGGRDVLLDLVKRADVLIENMRPKVKHRLRIDYETLREVNPRLVYASISGFGQTGPYSDRPGYDQVIQGMSGLMSVTGLPGQEPVRAGIAVSDSATGLYCALGVLTALLEREASGEGQWVHTSLLEGMIGMMDFQAARYLVDRVVPKQEGNKHPTSGGPTGVFPTSDGLMNISSGTQKMWERLCEVVGDAALASNPDYATSAKRRENNAAMMRELAVLTAKRTTAEWVSALNDAGVPCGPVYRLDQTFADPQVQHLGMAQPVTHPELGTLHLVRQPFRMSRSTSTFETAAPARGQHTDEVLRELGYDASRVARLRELGVV